MRSASSQSISVFAERISVHRWLAPEQTIITSTCGFNPSAPPHRARQNAGDDRSKGNPQRRLALGRWRKADSNPRSRLYERVCRVLPKGDPERPAGSRIKLRSSRETAMATGVRSAAIPFTMGPKFRIWFAPPLCLTVPRQGRRGSRRRSLERSVVVRAILFAAPGMIRAIEECLPGPRVSAASLTRCATCRARYRRPLA